MKTVLAARAHRPARPHPSVLASRVIVAASGVAFAPDVLAYVGPGAGLGVVGTLFGIVAALVLAMFGLFWYPIKRALGRKPAAVDGAAEAGAAEGADAVDDEGVANARDADAAGDERAR